MSVLSEAIPVKAPDAMDAGSARRAEYGSRRGWCLNQFYRTLLRSGAFRRERRVDWDRVDQFIFVCRGNICRSPYAARRARTLGLRSFSCGLHIGDNDAIDPLAAHVASCRGLDLTQHLPRPIDAIHLRRTDLLIGMEPAHLPPLRKSACACGAQVTLLGLWSTPAVPCLTDPYGLCEAYFYRCFMHIDAAVAGLAGALTEARDGP